jgi:septum formation protein
VRLILASASPRRADLLRAAGIEFDVVPATVDETPRAAEPAADYVRRLACEKARSGRRESGSVVLGADTTVVLGECVLGKPATGAEAREMLKLLSGRVHEVLTGVAFRHGNDEVSDVVSTRVRFLPLSEKEIAWYVSTGEPAGKAGGYAIQGRASRFVDWIEGSYSNVVGLPVSEVYQWLLRLGWRQDPGPGP